MQLKCEILQFQRERREMEERNARAQAYLDELEDEQLENFESKVMSVVGVLIIFIITATAILM